MARNLKLLPKAVSDLEEIFNYIAYDLCNNDGAYGLICKFENKFSELTTFPKSYPLLICDSLKSTQVRKCVVENYLVFYVYNQETDTIEIVRVIYGKVDYFSILE